MSSVMYDTRRRVTCDVRLKDNIPPTSGTAPLVSQLTPYNNSRHWYFIHHWLFVVLYLFVCLFDFLMGLGCTPRLEDKQAKNERNAHVTSSRRSMYYSLDCFGEEDSIQERWI